MKRLNRILGVVLLGASVHVGAGEAAAANDAVNEAPEFSQAETLMWMTDQLASVSSPVDIRYHFVRGGSLEPGFEDKVVFTISEIKEDGMKAAALNFFTGERNFPIPPVEATNVNPVLGVYLQGDVYELNRLTDERGSAKERWRYFHRQIKHALSKGAEVSPVTIEFDGKSYAGQHILFYPFENDPHRAEFEDFADKRYSVMLSEELPGYLYQIETVVPGEGKNYDNPLVLERLTLEAVEPREGA